MRTSKSQQAKTHRLIIQTAVELMTQQGFEATTMKQIAREAKLGDATIYKYFPSKEQLVLAYFELAYEDGLAQWRQTPQTDFQLQERLQLLLDTLLERLQTEREFVTLARDLLRRAPLLMLGEDLPGKRALKHEVEALLSQAEEAGEIAPCGLKSALAGLLADYSYGVIGFWLRDTSEQFGDTTRLLDLSLSVLVLALQTGMVNKLLDLGSFMLRSQLLRLLQQDGSGLIDLLKLARQGLTAAARP